MDPAMRQNFGDAHGQIFQVIRDAVIRSLQAKQSKYKANVRQTKDKNNVRQMLDKYKTNVRHMKDKCKPTRVSIRLTKSYSVHS